MRLCVFSLRQADVFSLVNRLARTMLIKRAHTHAGREQLVMPPVKSCRTFDVLLSLLVHPSGHNFAAAIWREGQTVSPSIILVFLLSFLRNDNMMTRTVPTPFLLAASHHIRSGRKGGRGERRREAVVGGASFKTVGSALLVAEMSANFLQFAAHFPAIATDVLTRLGELLRVSAIDVVFCSILLPSSSCLPSFDGVLPTLR